MTPEQRKKNREARRKWWRNLTLEQREKQRERRRSKAAESLRLVVLHLKGNAIPLPPPTS